MDFVSSLNSMTSQLSSFNIRTLLKNSDISRSVQDHLVQVFLTLGTGILASAAGVYFHLLFNLAGIMSMLGCMGVMMYLTTDTNKQDTSRRVPLFWLFCGLKGMSLGGLVEQMLYVDPTILLVAFVGTAAIFGCFCLSAMIARRRSMLYLGGLLSSAMSLLFMLQLARMFGFGGGDTMQMFQLVLGLAMFCGYVCVDTQMVVERASLGDRDVVGHALCLFTDLAAIFVRVALILLRNQQRRQQEESRRRRR